MITLPMPLGALLASVLVAAAASAQSGDARDGGSTVVDLDFRGGTAGEYVAAIRRAAGNVNVVFEPGLETMRVAPVQLKQVDVASAVELLDDLRYQVGEHWVNTSVRQTRQRSARSQPIFRVHAEPSGPGSIVGKPRSLKTHVWSLAPHLESGLSPEDLLTAVETAIEMHDDGAAPAQLRFHRETGLLLCRAGNAQLETVDSVVRELRQHRSRSDEEQKQAEAQRRAAQAENEHLRARLGEYQQMDRALTTWQTRAELYQADLSDGREEAQALRDRMQAEVESRDARIRELTSRVEFLERRLAERND